MRDDYHSRPVVFSGGEGSTFLADQRKAEASNGEPGAHEGSNTLADIQTRRPDFMRLRGGPHYEV
jgi:hypothetical protein